MLAALPADGTAVPVASLSPAARRVLPALIAAGAVERVPGPAAEPTEPRRPELPSFRLTDAQRREFVRWINQAKQEATTRKRVAESIRLLEQGKKLGSCRDRA